MLVQDVMTKSIRTVKPETKLLEVASVMCLYRIPALPVVDDDGKLVGNISEIDLLKNLFPSMEDLMSGPGSDQHEKMMPNYGVTMTLKVKDLMASNPISVTPDMHVLKAAAKMAGHKFRRIPVADVDGKLVGVMSLGDVHKAVFHAHLSRANCSTD